LLICKNSGNVARYANRPEYNFMIDRPVTDRLSRELERITTETIFQRRVFFIRNLGFVTPTAARRISFEETLRFERVHEETYRKFGFEIVLVEPARLSDRVAAIKCAL
jgi:predicted ATPase